MILYSNTIFNHQRFVTFVKRKRSYIILIVFRAFYLWPTHSWAVMWWEGLWASLLKFWLATARVIAMSARQSRFTRGVDVTSTPECKKHLITGIQTMNTALLWYVLHRTYTFSANEVVVTSSNDNSDGELEITLYALMNKGTAVLTKTATQNGLQVC